MNAVKNIFTIILFLLTLTTVHGHADEGSDKLYKEAEFEHEAGLDDSAFKKYMVLAEKGNSSAQYRIAYMYLKGPSQYGEGPTKDTKLALEWLQKAATQGHLQAQTNLGHMYFYGEGIPVDKKLAKFWYMKSAAQDNNRANSQAYPQDVTTQMEEEIKQVALSESNEVKAKLNDAKAKGFDSISDLTFAFKIKATPKDLATLKALGVNTELDYNNAIEKKNKLAYPGDNNKETTIQFLSDDQEGKKIKLSATAYRIKLDKHSAEAKSKSESDKARAKAEADAAASASAASAAAAKAKAETEAAKARASAAKADKEAKSLSAKVDIDIDIKAKMVAFATIRNSTAIMTEVGSDSRWYQLMISTQIIRCSQLTETPAETIASLNKIMGVTKTDDIKIGNTTVEMIITQQDGNSISLYLGRTRCKAMEKVAELQANAKK